MRNVREDDRLAAEGDRAGGLDVAFSDIFEAEGMGEGQHRKTVRVALEQPGETEDTAVFYQAGLG